MQFEKGQKGLNSYSQLNGEVFSGLHQQIKLYPRDSFFSKEKWAIAVLIPEKNVSTLMSTKNIKIILFLLALILIGIILSLFISKTYIRPISKGLDIIKSSNFKSAPKTNVPEIDDLIAFLSENVLPEEIHKEKSEKPQSVMFEDFLKNTKKLSPAERAVFNLYIEGHTAKEIAELLFLSINTIKTHNKRIYMKLNVASREELLLYLNILKDVGMEID